MTHDRSPTLAPILLQSYQNSWPEQFELEQVKLQRAFGELVIRFHHIGSTSIPGCVAKPIIDILGVTPDITRVDRYNPLLAELDYEAKGEYGMRQRRFFTLRSDNFCVNLHLFEESNPEVERHLRFREYLRKYPQYMRQYSQLKRTLAEQFPYDITQYLLGKAPWIKRIDYAAAQEALPLPFLQKSKLRKQSWTPEEILRAMEANMHLHMTYFAKYLPSWEIVFEPDVTVLRADIPDDTFNYVLFAKFNEQHAQERVSHVIESYRAYALPFSWWVGERDSPTYLNQLLMDAGLSFKEQDVGMYLNLDAYNAHQQVQEPLAIQRIDSPTALREFCNVIEAIGGNPQSYELIYSQLPKALYCDGAAFELYVGYLDNQAVVSGVLVLDANVAGIYYVATVPDQRKQGFGTWMLRHLLARAKEKKYTIATLQASQQGKALYERLGFQAACLFTEYAWSPPKWS